MSTDQRGFCDCGNLKLYVGTTGQYRFCTHCDGGCANGSTACALCRTYIRATNKRLGID